MFIFLIRMKYIPWFHCPQWYIMYNTGLIPILLKWTVFLLLFIFRGLSESCVYLVSFYVAVFPISSMLSVGVDTSVTDDIGTKKKFYHHNLFCVAMVLYLLQLPRFYYNILSHHNRLDNTDKAGLIKVRFLLSILDQKRTFRIICWGRWISDEHDKYYQ
jgi:hypothetical protein